MSRESTVSVNQAIEQLRRGGVVALPTETVYGLAADIFNEEALRQVFAIKARPYFDPLIVHVESLSQVDALTEGWSLLHQFLAERFWPGPLTLIAPKSTKVSDLITSGLETVALRSPRHPLFQAVLKGLGQPLAAPSANRFGKTSPTQAQHVMNEFNHQVDVLDGGDSDIGIESTVVFPQKLSFGYALEILRPGAVTKEMLLEAVETFEEQVSITAQEKQNSPGHLKHHYQPDKPLFILEGFASESEAREHLSEHLPQYKSWGTLQLSGEPSLAARQLYSELRRLSSKKIDALYVLRDSNQKNELWTAVWDRLERASSATLLQQAF